MKTLFSQQTKQFNKTPNPSGQPARLMDFINGHNVATADRLHPSIHHLCWQMSRTLQVAHRMPELVPLIESMVMPRTEALMDTLSAEVHKVLTAMKRAGTAIYERMPEILHRIIESATEFTSRMRVTLSRTRGVYELIANYNHYFVLFIYVILSMTGMSQVAEIMLSLYLISTESNFLRVIGVTSVISKVANRLSPSTQGIGMTYLIPLACVAAAGVFGFATKDIVPSSYHQFAKAMDSHRRIFQACTSIGKTSSDFIVNALKTFGFQFLGIDPELEEEMPADIKEFTDKLKGFTMEKRQSIDRNVGVANEAFSLYDEWSSLRTKYRENRVLSTLLDKSQGLCVNLQTAALGNTQMVIKQRVEPVVLMIKGGSGVGKSSLMYHFGSLVLAHTGAIKSTMTDAEINRVVSSCIYPRAAENEYWEGYKNTPVTLVDDAFQVVDSTSNPNLDYMELIRMSNGFPYPLHMASIAGKTNNNFTSKAVVYTTNVDVLAPASLISSEAVCRRVTMPYEVKLKPGVNVYDLPVDGGIQTDIYEFYKWNPRTGHIGVVPYTFDQVVHEFKQRLVAHERRFCANKGSLIRFARSLVDDPGEGSSQPTVQGLMDWWRPLQSREAHNRIVAINRTEFERQFQAARDVFYGVASEEDLVLGQDLVYQMAVRHELTPETFDANHEFLCEEWFQHMRLQYRYQEYTLTQALKDSMSTFLEALSEYVEPIGKVILWATFALTVVLTIWTGIELYRATAIPDEAADFPELQALQEFYGRLRCGFRPTKDDYALIARYRAFLKEKVRTESSEDKDMMEIIDSYQKAEVESGKARKRNVARVEGWSCSNAQDICALVKRNQVLIRVSSEHSRSVDPIHALMIQGHDMLINRHYVRMLNRYEMVSPMTIEIFQTNSDAGVSMLWKDVRATEEPYGWNNSVNDLCILHIEKLQRFPSIIKHLIKKEDIDTIDSRRITMSIRHDKEWQLKFGTVERVTQHVYTDEIGNTLQSMSMVTNISSTSGECGAVYILDDSRCQRKIAAIHFAGIGGKAYGVPLLQEYFEDGGEYYEPVDPPVQGNILFLGKATLDGKKYNQYGQTKSKLRMTKMFNEVFTSPNQPATLNYDFKNTILTSALMKQTGPVPLLDKHALNLSTQDYYRMLTDQQTFEHLEVLSFVDAVRGVPGETYMGGICRSTSAGFPYSQRTRRKGKTEWFGETDWIFGDKAKELEEDVMAKIKRAEQGQNLTFIFTDTLKDETRPVAKAHKPRLFAAAPLDFIIIFRMYFLSFLNEMMKNRINNESAVGIKAQSMEWHQLALKLTQFQHVVAGDFSNYDGTLHPDILWEIFNIIDDYYRASAGYKPEDTEVRKELWFNIVQSTHLVNDCLYRLNHSQPSGNPATAILNSMYNSLACRYVFYKQFPFGADFRDYVSMVAYGDDNVLSISPLVIENYNQHTMSEGFKELGMVYTDESKSGLSPKYRTLQEVSFLKRSFYTADGIWYGPLDIASILDCFNWIHETRNEFATIESNYLSAGIELALHKHEIWEFNIKKLKNAIFRNYGKLLQYPSREFILGCYRDGTMHDHYDIQWV